jgi:hypothetical protein
VQAPTLLCVSAHHPTTDYSVPFVKDRRLPGRDAHDGFREECPDLAAARILYLARYRRTIVADLNGFGL